MSFEFVPVKGQKFDFGRTINPIKCDCTICTFMNCPKNNYAVKMKKKVWKVAVIGCGAFANWHYLGGISKEASAVLVATVDIIPERAEQAAKKYGAKEWYTSVYELIETCDFDIAIEFLRKV